MYPTPPELHTELLNSTFCWCFCCCCVQARAVEDAEREAAANKPELEEGEELCNCEFSLAYGAKILLNNATMRLLRGHR